jgi:predicted nucleotidyltransferase
MKERVLAALRDVESEYDVKILLAVESGSRAWGFASPDSDYDVRFVYVHRRDWYLTVEEQRDVIEKMLPFDLDVSGWELRKALRLFAKSNLAFNEWIGSPIVYSSERLSSSSDSRHFCRATSIPSPGFITIAEWRRPRSMTMSTLVGSASRSSSM